MTHLLKRRRVLRGMLNGGAVTVGLPLLNCFLNGSGTALAAGGALPQRFGTWFWGLGMTPGRFIPQKVGADYDLPPELEPIKDIQSHINVFTNYNLLKDDNPSLCHYSGWVGLRCGILPVNKSDLPDESLDVTIGKKIGGFTRFRALDAVATGNPRDAVSFLGPNSYNTPEISPVALYTRVFGPEFQNPNGGSFTPSTQAMIRKSVLSTIMEDTKTLEGTLGAEDKARLDQYFTGLRDVEIQLQHQLTKPEPREACVAPKSPAREVAAGLDYKLCEQRHKLMTDLMAMTIACDQTRVFNMAYSASTAITTRPGQERPHHVATHDEPDDPKLGYQVSPSWFIVEAMKNWTYFVKTLAGVKEGDGNLLDNMLIYAHSDQEFARIHSMDGIPMFTAGKAGGRVKTGQHFAGNKEPSTRLGLTLMKIMGVDIDVWGAKSNRTSKPIGELLV